MTPDAQRIAIAEARGWKFPELTPGIVIHPKGGEISRVFALSQVGPACVPDYPNDLNAIREAVVACIKTEAQQISFVSYLHEAILNYVNDYDDEPSIWHRDVFKLANATAGQVLQALVKTLNLWDDTK